jgi:hypothetical protein
MLLGYALTRWTGVTMKTLLAGTLLTCIAAFGQTATEATEAKHLSDAFAKITMRLVLAIRESDGSLLAEQRVNALYQDAEMEQSTATEDLILKDLAVRRVFYRADRELNSASGAPWVLPEHHHAEEVFKEDIACFNAYISGLKLLSASIPSECLANDAKRTSESKRTEEEQDKAQCAKEQRAVCKPAREQSVVERNLHVWLDSCIDLRGNNGKNAKAIAKCNAKYDKDMKERGLTP